MRFERQAKAHTPCTGARMNSTVAKAAPSDKHIDARGDLRISDSDSYPRREIDRSADAAALDLNNAADRRANFGAVGLHHESANREIAPVSHSNHERPRPIASNCFDIVFDLRLLWDTRTLEW